MTRPHTDKAACHAAGDERERTMKAVPEMIERVAMAIWDAENGIDGDAIGTMIHASDIVQVHGDDRGIPAAKEVCRTIARAAIAAMREPTLAVAVAVECAIQKQDAGQELVKVWNGADPWLAAIDAALGNTEVAR